MMVATLEGKAPMVRWLHTVNSIGSDIAREFTKPTKELLTKWADELAAIAKEMKLEAKRRKR